MTDPTTPLRNHVPSHEFLVCIDSDGCAFDTMEIKQKECFIPVHCRVWGLQSVAKFARQAGEFVNLYSQWRGINRFPAMLMVLDLLDDWDEVQKRGFKSPEVPNLRRWVETESKLGNPALKAYCETHSEADEPDMHRALRWSIAVNDAVEDIVRDVPPFPFVRESLEKAKDLADILVCSATPHDALQREWQEHGIDGYPFTIAGQEQGKKSEHIEMCAKGKYDPAKVLMIGDAPGDMKAARANNALFFPILPGTEEVSWQRLHDEAMNRFVAGTYAGAYEEELIREFNACLPDTPPWKKK